MLRWLVLVAVACLANDLGLSAISTLLALIATVVAALWVTAWLAAEGRR